MKNDYAYLDLLEHPLDDQQKKVCCSVKNAVVAAGAGSGKTQVLATRFAWLVMEFDDIRAPAVLTLTFTKKAAAEMYARIYKTLVFFSKNERVPERQRKNAARAVSEFADARIQTLDSYCGAVVRQAANRYGIRPDFTTGSTDSERNIKNLALPFVLKNLSRPGIRHFAEAGKVQEFSDSLVAKIIGEYTSLATESGRFMRSLETQKSIISDAWKKIVSDKTDGSLFDIVSNVLSLCNEAKSDASCKWQKNAAAVKLFSFIETQPFPDFASTVFLPDDVETSEALYEKLFSAANWVTVLSAFKPGNAASSLKAIKACTENLARYADELTSLAVYVKEFPYIKDMCSLFDELLELVNRQKRTSGALTFKDVSDMALKILIEQKDIRNQEKAAFSKIMIDEFQDNNGRNRDLLFLLAERLDEYTEVASDDPEAIRKALVPNIAGDTLFFVGDEKQSIYKFRGADVSVFNELKRDLARGEDEAELRMVYNYRSFPELLTSFNQIFGGFYKAGDDYAHKDGTPSLFPQTPGASYEALYTEDTVARYVDKSTHERGAPIALDKSNIRSHFALLPYNQKDYTLEKESGLVPDVQEQIAYYIAEKIVKMHEAGEPYASFAVLDRSRTKRNYLKRRLEQFRIPYVLDRQIDLFADAPANDIYAFLRLCVYPSDMNAFAAFLCSPFAGLTENDVKIILANASDYRNKDFVFAPFSDDEKVAAVFAEGSIERERYIRAADFFKTHKERVLAEPLTKTLNTLWYDMGYRYETMLNRAVSLFAEQYDLLFEAARQTDADGKDAAYFVDMLASQKEADKGFTFGDGDTGIGDISYPIEKGDAVQIMTVHKSKGLQFDHVFVLGAFDNVKNDSEEKYFFSEEAGVSLKPAEGERNYFFIKQRDENLAKDIAEFRRLIYVAATRAIKDYYFVGTYSYDKDHKHRVSDASVFDPVIAYYYPDFLDSDAAVQYTSGAPFDLERIEKKSKREIYASSRIPESIDVLRKRKIRDADALFSSSEIDFIKMPELSSKRITPSSLEKLYDEEAGRTEGIVQSTETAVYKGESAVRTEAGSGEAAGGDLYPEIDELLEKFAKENVRFGFDEFGTLVHACLENAMNGFDSAGIKLASEKYMRKLSEAQQDKMNAVCEKICACFAASEYGARALKAREEGAWIKTEYAFKMCIDSYIVTGSIDLVFDNGGGTYTIVDYKTDHEIDPARYYRQQSCYRKAVAILRNVPEENVRCVLYYVRHNEFSEIPHGDFSLKDIATGL
ncbi:UvrD-helicase domain-containing protein [Treponema socranskii]|uniref:UvrD-helicase domain-containing protein n=1 Tax=Treponema socranskii TaxID=53419 RepID=UPI003D8EF99E